jgi:Uma2 family endonuclease
MATTIRGTATEAELLESPADGRKYELVRGHLVVSPGGFQHGHVALAIASALHAHARTHGLGRAFDSSTGFRFPGGDVLSPDAAFVAQARIPQPEPEGFPDLVPDLVVEVLSPSERPRAVTEKVRAYLEAGVRLVWVVNPRTRTVTVHAVGRAASTVGEDGVLDGEVVVPGFRCALRDVLD